MEKKLEFKKTNYKLMIWTFSWVATLALVTFGQIFIWTEENKYISIIGLILNVLVGIGMIYTNRDLLTKMDELQRKIHLESMAITLGLSVIFGIAYSTCDSLNIIPFDAEISILVIFIGLCYLTSVLIGNRRYS